jgi:hypothetical protein
MRLETTPQNPPARHFEVIVDWSYAVPSVGTNVVEVSVERMSTDAPQLLNAPLLVKEQMR